MYPFPVAPAFALDWWRRLGRIACKPVLHVEVIEVVRPQHPGDGLALHEFCIGAGLCRLDGGVKLVGLLLALCEEGIEIGEGVDLTPCPLSIRWRGGVCRFCSFSLSPRLRRGKG